MSTPGSGRRRPVLLAAGLALVLAATGIGVGLALASGRSPGRPGGRPAPSPTSVVTPATPSSSPASAGLFAQTAFNGCTPSVGSQLLARSVLTQAVCRGPDVAAKVGAQEVYYARFRSYADLNSWFTRQVLARNRIRAGRGYCPTGDLVTAAVNSYCEGTFTDSSGALANETIIVAASTENSSFGGSGDPVTFCRRLLAGDFSSYTLLIWTAPSDTAAGVALACQASLAGTSGLEQHLLNGDLDLHP
ncbi:MAG TPA: hypothetical protein VNG13_07245 [Mycobacteriales bacterium]|nr:hypothetical protein [Mycobacteriales bacterium]